MRELDNDLIRGCRYSLKCPSLSSITILNSKTQYEPFVSTLLWWMGATCSAIYLSEVGHQRLNPCWTWHWTCVVKHEKAVELLTVILTDKAAGKAALLSEVRALWWREASLRLCPSQLRSLFMFSQAEFSSLLFCGTDISFWKLHRPFFFSQTSTCRRINTHWCSLIWAYTPEKKLNS